MKGKPPTIKPRIVNQKNLAHYLGKTPSWLAQNKERLFSLGMPKPLPYVKGYDLKQIDLWLDRLGKSVVEEDPSGNNRIINEWSSARGRFK